MHFYLRLRLRIYLFDLYFRIPGCALRVAGSVFRVASSVFPVLKRNTELDIEPYFILFLI